MAQKNRSPLEDIFEALITTIPQFAWFFALLLLVPAPISAIKAYQKKAILNNQKDLNTIRNPEMQIHPIYKMKQGFSG